MFKLSLPLCASLILLSVTTVGCEYNPAQLFTAKANTNESVTNETITHLEFTIESLSPGKPSSISHAEVYVTPTTNRLTLQEDGNIMYALWDGHDQYLYSDTNEQIDQSSLPEDHPFKNVTGEPIIKVVSDNNPGNFLNEVIQPLIMVPNGIDPSKTAAYTIELPDQADPTITRRYTIDPATQLASQVESIDQDGNVFERYVIQTRETVTVPTNFFSVEDWQSDLPGDDFVIIEDDLN